MTQQDSTAVTSHTLKKTLSLPLLIGFGIAYLQPLVVFTYYGIYTPGTGGMFTLAYFVTTLAMILTAFSYKVMVTEFPVAGSAYTYVQKSVQPHVGFLTGWVMLLDYMLLPMLVFLTSGIYVNHYVPAIPVWACVVALAIISTIINCLGIKMASVVDTVICILAFAFCLTFLVFVVQYVTQGGGAGTLFSAKAIYNPETFSSSGLLAAAAVLCLTFMGFDAVSTLAEEAKDQRSLGKAVMWVAVIAGILFVVVAYCSQIAWPEGYMLIQDPDAGIFELFAALNANWLGDAFFLLSMFAGFTCAMAGIAAASRILFGMGRDNILPKRFFGHLSKRYQTPTFNIFLTTAVSLFAIFYQDDLAGAASLVSFGCVCGFFMVNIAVITKFYIKEKHRDAISTIKYLIFPSIAAITLIVVFVFIMPSAKIIGFGWLAVGVIYLAVKTGGFKRLPPEMTIEE